MAAQNGMTMSTMPRYYGGYYGGGFTPRPATFVVAGAVGFMFYRAGTHTQCSYSSYADGHACRACSDWICPMGQYRVSCTPYSDSYCNPCTNKPAGNYVYTSPGNDNDCATEPCSTDAANTEMYWCDSVVTPPPAGFLADSSTDLVFYIEMPVNSATFASSLADKYHSAIQSLAGDNAQSVTVSSVLDVPASTFRRRIDSTGISTRRQAAEGQEPMPAGNTYVMGGACLLVGYQGARTNLIALLVAEGLWHVLREHT